MEDWEEDQSPVVTNMTFGNAGNSNSGGFSCINDKESSWQSDNRDFGNHWGNRGQGPREGGGGFRSFSSGNDDENENKEVDGGSSWNGGGERFRGGRGRGGRGGFKNSFNSDVDENGNCGGFKSDFGGKSVRGGRGGHGGRGGRGAFQQGGDVEGKRCFSGGYRGRDEEVFSKGSQKNDEEKGDCGTAGPKVSYVPPPPPEDEGSVFAHYATGINFNKYDDILVDVSGSNPPKAILTFEEAQLCETLSRNIAKSGYGKPTPVQKHGIPIISAGRDLMACAQTGSGKTAAFLLPILQSLMSDGVAASKFSEVQEPEVVIVAPTRELINQIYLEARKFAYGTCVRPVVVYGGTNTGYTIREVLKGCNILCGTPGRLLDIIGRGKVGLSKVRHLVLDEADRMLDMGFESDMRKLVSSPGMPSKEERQTLMFSATYPEDIQRLAANFLKVDYLFLAVGVVGGACSDVEQQIIEITQFSKREKLLELLKATGTERTMVFVETKRSADFIATFLCQEEVPTTSIHGDREQREREKALSDFRTGRCPVLVATSVAARGLDIEHVQHVVNFDLPKDIDEYVHRIGRTGRCGNVGKAMSFFDAESDAPLARSLVKVLSGAQQEVPSWLEEIAFSAHGTTGFNPRGKVFASTDTRRGESFQMKQTWQPAAQSSAAEADEDWE